MKDDYLWDGSGEPDPEVQKLERALRAYRHDTSLPDFGTPAEDRRPAPQSGRSRWGWVYGGGAIAAVLVLAAGGVLVRSFWRAEPGRGSWEVARLAGHPRFGWHRLGERSAKGSLEVGQTLVTDAASRATLTREETGTVEVEEGSRVRLISTGPGRKRLSLERGTIRATIWAPPGEFVMDTPSAVAVDLGCVYTLRVDESGAGLLRTTMGWVGFHANSRESFIPAGALCVTRPNQGPGTPYREDASAAFREALERFDFGRPAEPERRGLVRVLLSEARASDSVTLWHLLARVGSDQRPAVFDRFAALAPPPGGVTREGVLGLDRQMMDRWWNSLGFGDVELWRTYEREWALPGKP